MIRHIVDLQDMIKAALYMAGEDDELADGIGPSWWITYIDECNGLPGEDHAHEKTVAIEVSLHRDLTMNNERQRKLMRAIIATLRVGGVLSETDREGLDLIVEGMTGVTISNNHTIDEEVAKWREELEHIEGVPKPPPEGFERWM